MTITFTGVVKFGYGPELVNYWECEHKHHSRHAAALCATAEARRLTRYGKGHTDGPVVQSLYLDTQRHYGRENAA